MKKTCLLLMSFVCLSTLSAYSDSPCDNEVTTKSQSGYTMPCKKPCEKPSKKSCRKPCMPKCPQTYNPCPSECFLCTNKNMNTLFSQIGLSETQICTAEKIQEKYELEVLSLNEKIHCEDENLNYLKRNCASRSDLRKQRNVIKKLKKERTKICKCYEKQFKALLSDQQKSAYRKYKKCS